MNNKNVKTLYIREEKWHIPKWQMNVNDNRKRFWFIQLEGPQLESYPTHFEHRCSQLVLNCLVCDKVPMPTCASPMLFSPSGGLTRPVCRSRFTLCLTGSWGGGADNLTVLWKMTSMFLCRTTVSSWPLQSVSPSVCQTVNKSEQGFSISLH